MWGGGGRCGTRAGRRSAPFQRAHFPHRPLAVVDPAGVALQPGFRSVADVAREEVAAGEPVLRVGVRDRRDRAARAGAGILPRLACVFLGAREHERGGRPGGGKGMLTRGRRSGGGGGAARRVLLLLVLEEKKVVLGELAAAAGRGPEPKGGREGRGAHPP